LSEVRRAASSSHTTLLILVKAFLTEADIVCG
jgi:hypothetical protein